MRTNRIHDFKNPGEIEEISTKYDKETLKEILLDIEKIVKNIKSNIPFEIELLIPVAGDKRFYVSTYCF